MGNASLSKFAINRKTQVDKDTIKVDDLMYHPHAYGGGFTIATEVDSYGDLVESKFEASKSKILSAVTAGGVVLPATPDALALLLASGMGTINSTLLDTPKTFADVDVNTATDIITLAAHGFTSGDPVRLSNSGGALPTGLVSTTEYFVYAATSGTFSLHTNETDALTGANKVDITAAAGGGTHSIFWPAYSHVITVNNSASPNYHTILYHDGVVDCRVIGAVLTSLGFRADYESKRMNLEASFTGITREANNTSYPSSQVLLNPIHFTLSGADLKIYKNGTLNTDYDENRWAGFQYGFQNAVSAEHRAGSNALSVIEIGDKGQSLGLVLDYYDNFFKNTVQDYQSQTTPPKFKIDLTLKGTKIDNAATYTESMNMVFYNAVLGDHGYSQSPEIGKQSLSFGINYDADAAKSSQITIVNRTPSYLT
jgi:hypothetical protein